MKKAGKVFGFIIIYIGILVGWLVTEKQYSDERIISAINAEQGTYYLTQSYEGSKSLLSLWELKKGECIERYQHLFEGKKYSVTYFGEEENKLVVAGVEQLTGEVVVYFYEINQDKVIAEKKVYDKYALYTPVSAIYENGCLSVMDKTGKIYSDNGKIQEKDFYPDLFEEDVLAKIDEQRKQDTKQTFLLITVGYWGIVIILWILAEKLLKKKEQELALPFAIVMISAVAAVFVYFIAGDRFLHSKAEERMELNEVYILWQKSVIEEGNHIYDSKKLTNKGEYLYFQASIVAFDDKKGDVVFDSSSERIGSLAETVFGKEGAELVEKCRTQEDVVSCVGTQNEEKVIYSAVLLENNQVLIVKTSMQDCINALKVYQKNVLLITVGVWLLFNVVLNLLLFCCLVPFRKMKHLIETANFLEIPRYQNNRLLNFYSRFVPYGFEKIFEKQSMQDINIGEFVQHPAVVSYFCLNNVKESDRYQSFHELLMQVQKYKNKEIGILLLDNNEIEKLEILYKDTKENIGIAAMLGIYVLNDLMMRKTLEKDLLPYIFLHKATINCGVIGDENIAVPIVQSEEMKFLNAHMKELNKYGIHMVVSEEINEYLERKIETRYIGFVEIPSGNKRVKLYEVLDACSHEERFKKQSTLELFIKGLEQFYNNDFYYARNTFLDVLKKCPEDKLSRWYAYACEEMFNLNDYDSIRHDLFFEK